MSRQVAPVLVALSLAALPLAAQEAKSYTLSGRDVAIYNLAGEVSLVAGSGAGVGISVTPIGHDADRLTIEEGDLRGRPTLRVLYPDTRIVYPALGRGNNSSFTVREDGTWGGSGDGGHGRSEGRKVTVRGDGNGLEAAANLRISVPSGQRVSVYLGVGRMDVTNVEGDLRLDLSSGNVAARGTRGRLDIDTGSGDVTLNEASGEINLDTGSGDVTVTRVSNGDLKVDTGSGSVNASGVTTTAVDIETGSGDIEMAETTAPRISLETGSGSVRATLRGALEQLHVDTGSGDVTIHLPEGLGATVDLGTGSGEFTVDFPLQMTRKSEGNLRGQLGDGHGRIEIETGSGDIALVR